MSPTPPDVITVNQCIGCGAIETPQPCLGGCHEHRLDLVPADEHAAAVATVHALRTLLAERRTLLGDLERSSLADAEWAALRRRARRLAHPVAAGARARGHHLALRQLAWTTPRARHRDDTARALRKLAQQEAA